LAEFADELLVFQRTPSSVDARDNRETDPDSFKNNVASHPGWWRERNKNFANHIECTDPLPDVNLVSDGWTEIGTYITLVGHPANITMENVREYVEGLHARDYPRTERIRQRTKEIVKDKDTAEALQAWYPSWCKVRIDLNVD
jgi:cation diffusion facilitator CzcD-associated flavoprotein CzcO